MNYTIDYLWEQGARMENEDSLAIMQLTVGHTPAIFALVADGIGGMDGGELASGIIANRLKCAFERASYNVNTFTLKSLRKILTRELYSCHADLTAYSKRYGTPLGSTCSLICLIGRKGFLLHIGDSHIYSSARHHLNQSRNQHLTLLSRDHSNKKGHLTRCIGHGTYHGLQHCSLHLKANDILLLCTDGFYRRMTDDIINLPKYLTLFPQDTCLKHLHTLATRRGESDNAGAILIQLSK